MIGFPEDFLFNHRTDQFSRPIANSKDSKSANLISEKDLYRVSARHDSSCMQRNLCRSFQRYDTIPPPGSFTAPLVIDKLVPKDRTKLTPLANIDNTQPSTSMLSPDSIDASASSTSAAAAPNPPASSALEALVGKKLKPPTTLENIPDKPDKKGPVEAKIKESPSPHTDLDEDSHDIKTPPMTPRSPTKPMPQVLELSIPPTPNKSSPSMHCFVIKNVFVTNIFAEGPSPEIEKRAQYYRVSYTDLSSRRSTSSLI